MSATVSIRKTRIPYDGSRYIATVTERCSDGWTRTAGGSGTTPADALASMALNRLAHDYAYESRTP